MSIFINKLKSIIFILSIFFISPKLFSATCNSVNPLVGLSLASAQVISQINSQGLNQNPTRFCDINMVRRYLEANSDSATIMKMSDQEVMSKVQNEFNQDQKLGGNFVTLPILNDKKMAFLSSVLIPESRFGANRFNGASDFESTLDAASDVINSDICSYKDRPSPYNTIESLLAEKNGVSPIDRNDRVMALAQDYGPAVLCAEVVNVTSVFECSRSFNSVTNKMLQKGSPPLLSMPELYNKIINSRKYDQGLKIFANKMISNMKNPNSLKSNLFDDAVNSFIQAGYSPSEAKDMSFDVLGFIATGGSAIWKRIDKISFSGDRWPAITALTTIAASIPILDFYSSRKGQVYSFPKGVKGGCDTSKSYHFWMTAYLAREEVKSGVSPESASAAAFTVSKVYHVTGNLTNRTPGALLAHRPFSPATNIVRADLSYAAAGSLFGAGAKLDGRPLNIDQGIDELIDESVALPKLSREEIVEEQGVMGLFGYRRFSKIFAPNTVYRQMKRGLEFQPIPKVNISSRLVSPKCK